MLNTSNWKLHHVAHAVDDLDKTAAMYASLFGFSVSGREVLQQQNVELCFLEFQNSRIELLMPISRAKQSGIVKFLNERGPGLHHICFEVEDIAAELERLLALSVQLVDSVPRPGAHGSSIAFVHPKSTDGALIELCEVTC
ncbi:MAG: methylmalonyl-CoA epimerase [Bdellovibrionales bacterium]|nr:methylmalonyl-CoA epimerase [Bdellovibrionales bacterium]